MGVSVSVSVGVGEGESWLKGVGVGVGVWMVRRARGGRCALTSGACIVAVWHCGRVGVWHCSTVALCLYPGGRVYLGVVDRRSDKSAI